MTNRPDHVNRLEVAQSPIALHADRVSIVSVILRSYHLNDDAMNDAENETTIPKHILNKW